MWKEVPNYEYFLQFKEDNNGYEISATDYVTIWTTSFSRKAFIAQVKESNEGLELPNDNDYINKGVHMFSNLDKLKKINIRKEENGKTLSISMRMLMGFPFLFEFKLTKGSEEIYFEKITKPLLQTIGDLRASQAELRRLLLKKDKEIEEYKCEGGEIVLRHLKTVAFNDEEHMKKFKCYEENFGSNVIPASLLEKPREPPSRDIKQESSSAPTIKDEPNLKEPTKIKDAPITVKQEPHSIKQEPNTPVFDDSQSLIAPSVSCKQEMINTERPTRNDRRKRPKLNF